MASAYRPASILSRLAGRSVGEFATRGWQELRKRVDLARWRLGCQPAKIRIHSEAPGHSHFFFTEAQLPAILALLKERMPDSVEDIVRRAEAICRHQFDLLGYKGLLHGDPIDWEFDVVNGKRAPHKPWFRIHYLDFEEVGDAKIIWELNRHQHLTTLAKAYLLTADPQFARELFQEWYHWWQRNPYPMGINWASSLEVAFRALSWLWIERLIGNSGVTPKGFSKDLLNALGISGRHIERYLSTYFSPNTHLLGEGVALFWIGTLCPQLSAARRWQKLGWEIVLRQAERQVQPDGMHFEQSVYYHVYALDLFLHARILATANYIAVTEEYDEILQRMLEVLLRLNQAGIPPRLGDDDGGRLFDPQRNRAEHLTDPLAIGAALFNRGDFKAAGRISEEFIWLLGPQGVAHFDRLPAAKPDSSSVAFKSSGIVVMAAGEAAPQQAVVDAGRLGTGRGGHGHADALSLCLAINGREWLSDPGTFSYIAGIERDQFRGTRAHNTLALDGVDQAEPSEPFGWRAHPQVRIENWVAGQSFDLLVAAHTGYQRLPDPALHRRCIFYLKSEFWLVLDVVEGKGIHNLSVSWHLHPGLMQQCAPASGVCFAAEDQSGLALLHVVEDGWTREIKNGWHSPAYGKKEPSLTLQFEKDTQLPDSFATVLQPLPRISGDLGCLESLGVDKSVRGYAYKTLEATHYVFFASQASRWELGSWASDAYFLYCKVSPQQSLCALYLCGGAFVEMNGRRIFSAGRPVARFEWRETNAAAQVSCGDENAIDLMPECTALSEEITQ